MFEKLQTEDKIQVSIKILLVSNYLVQQYVMWVEQKVIADFAPDCSNRVSRSLRCKIM